jgi:hypothetical protein
MYNPNTGFCAWTQPTGFSTSNIFRKDLDYTKPFCERQNYLERGNVSSDLLAWREGIKPRPILAKALSASMRIALLVGTI